ncbi:hypothetical protein Tco_0053799 [Tanacetum coccineum]
MKNDIRYRASDFHRRSSSNKAAETCIHGRNDRIDIHARTHPHSSRSQADKPENNTLTGSVPGQDVASQVWKQVDMPYPPMWDTAYWGFLGVRITFDIFQNIHILYFQYDVLISSGYGVLIFFPLWSLVSEGTDAPYLLDGYDVLGKSSSIFIVDQSIIYGVL